MIEQQFAEALTVNTGGDMGAIVKELFAAGFVNDKRALRYVIHHEFWALFKKGGSNAYDIEKALAVKYNIDDRTVRYYRTSTLPRNPKPAKDKASRKRH